MGRDNRDKELEKLKRENQALRKRLKRHDDEYSDPFTEEEEAPAPEKKEKKQAVINNCPRCRKNLLEEVPIGPFMYDFCADRRGCGYRHKK